MVVIAATGVTARVRAVAVATNAIDLRGEGGEERRFDIQANLMKPILNVSISATNARSHAKSGPFVFCYK